MAKTFVRGPADRSVSAQERSYLERQVRRHRVAGSLSHHSAVCRRLTQQGHGGRAWRS
jgi:hypothetical protein